MQNLSLSLRDNCEALQSCAPEEKLCKRNAAAPAWYQIAGIAFFYMAILLTGIYATRRGKKLRRMSMDLAQDSMIAGRNIGKHRILCLLALAFPLLIRNALFSTIS